MTCGNHQIEVNEKILCRHFLLVYDAKPIAKQTTFFHYTQDIGFENY